MAHDMIPESFQELVTARPGPCVSIYVATPWGRGLHHGQVRLAQLLDQVETELEDTAALSVEIEQLLAPARALVDEPWPEGGGRTLALFGAPGFFRTVRADVVTAEAAVVGSRFHVRPLLPLLAAPPRFYVLALSLDKVRLIEATPQGNRRLPLGELEGSFALAMGYQEFYSELQVHSAGARRPGIVHGHGDRDEEKLDEDLRPWFRRIAEAVAQRTSDPRALRVLATTAEHVSPYRAASRDGQLLPHAVNGNPDHLSDGELVARARPLVAAALAEQRQEALGRWRELLGSDRATGDLATVLRLACQGRVQTLFLPKATELWGSYEAGTGRLDLHVERRPGDEELLERAAIETLGTGGEVYEMPQGTSLDGAPLAALLRR
jgi:hypothetical protein